MIREITALAIPPKQSQWKNKILIEREDQPTKAYYAVSDASISRLSKAVRRLTYNEEFIVIPFSAGWVGWIAKRL